VASWLRSLPTVEAAGAFAGERYGLAVRSCVLCRHGGRSAGEAAWEQDLVAYVAGRGVPCAAPAPLPDECFLLRRDPDPPRLSAAMRPSPLPRP
jgi:hypothetical protein